MAMLLFGANINHQSQVTQVQPLLSICQLALFNTVVLSSKEVPVLHHSKSREPPLPLYIGILIHNKTRKRHLVEKFYDLGLSVSYDRVMEVSTEVGTKVCDFYEKVNIVCPPQLKKGVFTTSAGDNINHQTSATTSTTSFNGTGISVFQHDVDETGPSIIVRKEAMDFADGWSRIRQSQRTGMNS